MLDQQTKQQFQQKFEQIKPQLQQQFPDLQEEDLQKGQSDPDQFVKTAAQKTGQPEPQIEQQLNSSFSSRRSADAKAAAVGRN